MGDRRLHLNVNALNAGVFGGSWRFPGTDPAGSYTLDHHLEIARTAERARLDAVFLADGPVIDADLRYRSANSFEPTALLARLAAETTNVGLIGTLSSSYNDPDELADRIGDLDLVSGGRVGWNVVTTAGAAAARNFGFEEEPDHAGRYRRAAEVVGRVTTRWEARPADRRSLQGRPVVVQAGGSKDGRALAAQIAEVVFSASADLDQAIAFRAEVRDGAAALGRDPDGVVVLPGLSTVIGATETEARERRELLSELLPLEYAKRRLQGQLGYSLDDVDLDDEIPLERLVDPDTAGGTQTFYRIVRTVIERDRPTFRQLLRALGGGVGHRIVVGTPEQVADDVERWFRAGAADGFNVMPDVLDGGLQAFTDGVVPVLQRRGLFRTEYEGPTLRDVLGLPVPTPAALEGALR